MKTILSLLCGLWAFGLGLRYTIELLASDGWIHVPKYAGYGVNLWFDFIPLLVMGFLVVMLETKGIVDKMRMKEVQKTNVDEA